MRLKRFFRTLPAKLWILLAAAVVFAFFSNDFGLVDIQKTAVILAVGLDKTATGYALSAEVAVPKGSDRTTGGTSSVLIEGEGETVAACVSELYEKTGWVPKLIFCDLIVLGEETARQNVFDCLDYFLRSEYFSDSCLLAVCEGRAADLLATTSEIDDTSSLAIEKLFSDASEKSGAVMKTTLREFARSYYGVSASGSMPYVRADQGADGSGARTEQGGQNGGQDTASAGGKTIYDAAQTALFQEGVMTALLSERETFAFSLLNGNVYAGTLTVDGMTLSVLKNRGSVTLVPGEAPVARMKIDIKVRLQNRSESASANDVALGRLTAEDEARIGEALAERVGDLWRICQNTGCDLFLLRQALYRTALSAYDRSASDLLAVVRPDIRVDVMGVW